MTARTVPTMPNFFAGQKLTGTLLNQVGSYGVFWANAPMFRMYQSIAQNLTNAASVVQIVMDTPVDDTDSGRNVATPYSYIIPAGMTGRWQLSWGISFATTSGAGPMDAILYRNGTAVTGAAGAASQNNDHAFPQGTVTIPVNAGDVMAVYGYQATGATLATFCSGQYAPFFEGRLVSLANP